MTTPRSDAWLEEFLDALDAEAAQYRSRLRAALDEIAWAVGAGHPAVGELCGLLDITLTPARRDFPKDLAPTGGPVLPAHDGSARVGRAEGASPALGTARDRPFRLPGEVDALPSVQTGTADYRVRP